MKCPTCGSENKSTNKACIRCGHVLDEGGIQPKGNANSLWNRAPAEHKTVRTPPPFWGDTAGKATYEDKSDFIVLHDESSDSNAAQDLVDRGAPVPDNRRKLERMKEGREVHVVVPARPAPRREQAARPRRYKIRWPRLIVSILALVALFAGVSFGGFWLYKLAVGSASQLFARGRSSELEQEPLVEKVMIDSQLWHKITFFGKDGEMVLVTDPKRNLQIQNGKAELLLNDQGYISNTLTDDKVTVSLEATIVSPDNTERKLTIEPYKIKVPLSPIKLVLPKEQTMSTNEDSVLVKIKVTPGSSQVRIGNTAVTDHVSPDGFASATVHLEPNGINTVLIMVETPQHRRNTMTLKIERPIMEVPIQLDKPESTSRENSVLIKGSTEQGATVTTNAVLKGSMKNEGGAFSFTAMLKRWGWNDIEITSIASNGRISKMVHRVYHEPTLDGYTKKAWPMDYTNLATSTDNLIGTVYVAQGVVIKKYESDEADYYQFNCGTPSAPQYIVVEYTKEDGLKQNQYYRLFADVTGTYEGYPVLTARFVYALPMPSEFATAAPTLTPEATATAGATAGH